jgi:ABC-type polysaccharide/polyol phosphate transport system ATPase subunit
MNNDSTVIRLEDVHQHFKVVHERPDTLREAFANFFRKGRNFEDFHALKGISLQVRRGEMVGVIGRNGSGKSTVLKIIAGVYVPTSGRVEVHGKVAALIELGAGFHPELTGRENIVLNGLLLGFTKADMRKREARIIDFAELGEFIDAPIKQYSSGMYARLAFAVATEVDPEILLLDEILSVGDAGFSRKCMERMESFRKSDKSILFVSHDLGSVARFCDRVLLINNGSIAADGPPGQVIFQYEEMFTESQSAART